MPTPNAHGRNRAAARPLGFTLEGLQDWGFTLCERITVVGLLGFVWLKTQSLAVLVLYLASVLLLVSWAGLRVWRLAEPSLAAARDAPRGRRGALMLRALLVLAGVTSVLYAVMIGVPRAVIAVARASGI